jgi:serine/threonine protein kinase
MPVIGGRYRLLECVGKGGMGTVYKAVHEALDKIVAVKLLRSDHTLDDSTIRRFEYEAKAASKLNHPNLASVFDYGRTEAGAPYLVMDFLDGMSLADLIKKEGQVNVKEAIGIFQQIAAALEYAHNNRVIHRDLKPSNIILMQDSEGHCVAKLVDFGIAKVLPIGDSEVLPVTGAGEIFGSPLYMSPEQCTDKDLDKRSDVYSFGCLMYESLTGQPPFYGENPVQTMYMHVNDLPREFRSSFPNVRLMADLERIVLKALAKDPDKRYQSMKALQEDLHVALESNDPQKRWKRTMMRILPKNKWMRAALSGIALFPITSLIFTGILALSLIVQPLAQMNSPWYRLNNLAYQAYNSGNIRLAENLMKQAIAAFPPDYSDVTQKASMHASLAKIYFEEGNLAQASRLYEETAQFAQKANMGEIAERCLLSKANCDDKLGLSERSAEAFAKVAEMMTQRLGAKTPALFEPLGAAGQRFFQAGNLESSRAVYLQLARLSTANPATDRDLAATAYLYLGRIEVREQHNKEAIDYFDQAVNIRCSAHGTNDPEAQQILKQRELLTVAEKKPISRTKGQRR